MSDMVYKIALAGLLHDVGKFAERAGMELEPGYENNNSEQYQPKKDNRPTHRHALYSAAFIERFAAHLPDMDIQQEAKSGNSLINLAAMHHKPETPLQWIITMADRLSSGLDRQVFEGDETGTAFRDFRKTRLIPLAEEMLRGDDFYGSDGLDSYQHRYPLDELSAKMVFPVARKTVEPPNDTAAGAEYAALFESFIVALGKLAHRDAPALWLDAFTSLWERSSALIPAATVGKVIPDVSLYDHSRATAALAAALYRHHSGTYTLTEGAIRNGEAAKFLLVTGDFFGIQNFIFSDGGSTNRAAAKLLRGRSFAVSMLVELAAQHLCERLELPPTSILLNAAGKFTLVAANLPESSGKISEVERELNDWLLGAYYGEVSIGFSSITASPAEFEQGKFPELWERLGKAADSKKYRKFGFEKCGAVGGYLDSFDNRLAVCPFCGKRPADPATRGDHYLVDNEASCRICRDHIHLGAQLVKVRSMALVRVDAVYAGNRLKAPLFGRYQISFDLDGDTTANLSKQGKLLGVTSLARAGEAPNQGYAVRYVSGYVPVYVKADEHDNRLLHGRMSEEKKLELIDMIKEGGAKSFQHIAKTALNPRPDSEEKFSGVEALGILKADVDNLGKLFACGLPPERLNLSRLATFSRQLDSFFTLYLPSLLASDSRFANIYTVFAGGDDLFLIGPWNRIIEFAGELQQQFERFSCGNKKITISAGITVNKPGVPVPAIAAQAEEALEAAKHGGRNSVTLFWETVCWDSFGELQQMRQTIEAWQQDGYVGKGLLYQLNGLIAMAKRERQIRDSSRALDLRDMECLGWRSKLHYSATRNVGKGLDKEARQAALDEIIAKLPVWLHKYDGKLKIALWQVLYNQR